jgi:amino acid transporter
MKVKHLSSGRCLFLTGSDYFGHYGWSGILRGAGVVFFAFIGFDAVSTAAQEAKIHKRNANWYFRFISNLYYFICPVCLRFNWFRKLS